jgi:PAS domain S-box-containing protein
MPAIEFATLGVLCAVNRGAWRAVFSSRDLDMQVELNALIDALPGLGWTALPDGRAEFLNQRWLEYTGMTAERAIGWGWIGVLHPDDRTRLVEHWQSCVASGTPVDAEGRMRRYDGAYRWFLFRANPLRDETGKISKWCGTNLDIEDRRRVEEGLRASELSWRQIVDNIPGFVATMGAMGEVEYLNRQTLDYFGKTTEELKNWSLIGAVHPDDLPRVIEARQRCIESGQLYEVEHRCRRADGIYRWFQVRGLPMRDVHGVISTWYLLLTDIDDRRRAEAQLEQAYLRLAEAQRLSKTGSFIMDLMADEHSWSDEALRIFEFDPGGKVTVPMIRDMVHPEDRPSFDAVVARAMTAADVDFLFRIVTSQGAVKHVRGMARLMTDPGAHPLFIGAVQDVTAGKLAEAALDRARSDLAHVARVTMLNTFTASIAHEVNQPLLGIITNASTCLRMLERSPPNVEGARETARRTIRDGNRAADVIARMRGLFTKKEFILEPLDLNDATREVITLSMSHLQRNQVIVRSELAEDLPLIVGDRVQVQQVILNLLRNASDAMIGVEGRARELLVRTECDDQGRVRLDVKDVGVGFAAETQRRLFEPHYTTKSDGMGIGLSVSRSIIERHHGRLWAEPNDGPGATFSFTLPSGRERGPGAAI